MKSYIIFFVRYANDKNDQSVDLGKVKIISFKQDLIDYMKKTLIEEEFYDDDLNDGKNQKVEEVRTIYDLEEIKKEFFKGNFCRYLLDWELEIRNGDIFD